MRGTVVADNRMDTMDMSHGMDRDWRRKWRG